MKKFSRLFAAKNNRCFPWFFMTVHHFWQLHSRNYNSPSDAAALLKMPKRNLDDKQRFALLICQTACENFDPGKGNNNNRVSIYIWHYNHQERFVNTCKVLSLFSFSTHLSDSVFQKSFRLPTINNSMDLFTFYSSILSWEYALSTI